MKIRKILAALFSAIILFTSFSHSLADFGNFDTYDGGGWDSGSDWSSDWDSDWSSSDSYYYFDSDYSDSDDEAGLTEFLIILAIIGLLAFVSYKKYKNKTVNTSAKRSTGGYSQKKVVSFDNKNDEIGNSIRTADPAFNTSKFLAFVNESYVKLQTAWVKRDLEPVRLILTEEMFAQMSPGVEQYKQMGRINMMERIGVQESYLTSYSTDNEKEILSVYLYATQKDYIIDEKTKQVLEGSATDFRHSKYIMTFIRTKGKLTETADGIEASNCPNCGAPLEITASGKCAYCDSVISNDSHSWVLSGMKRVN